MSYQAGGAAGQATIELVPEIAALDGIQRIYEEMPGRPGSSVNQPSPTLTAAQITNADQWHAIGFAGSGVGVGVMDFDFRDFRTRVPAPVLENVRYFCYDANGTVFAGDLRTPTHTAFSACETSDSPLQANPHGTDVAAALVEIAPDTNLYISNAGGPERVVQALRWRSLCGGVELEVSSRCFVRPTAERSGRGHYDRGGRLAYIGDYYLGCRQPPFAGMEDCLEL